MKVPDSTTVKQDSLNQINFRRAEDLYFKCINMQPDTFKIYQELMDLYVFTEKFSNAEKVYVDIKDKFDSDSLLNLLSSTLANAYTTSKEYKKAIEFYNKMIKVDSNDTYIYLQRAEIYEKMGKHKTAIREYNKILKRDSTLTAVFINLGRIYYEKYKDFRKAKEYLIAANERELMNYGTSSSNLDLHYYLGMIAVKERRKMDAILAYMEMKNIYTYTPEENKKKVDLYKEILKMR
jgi:tetratricopeptide (TPR) repeat protein